jgi:hypothetical protein
MGGNAMSKANLRAPIDVDALHEKVGRSIGAPGIGKSRLALQAAISCEDISLVLSPREMH